MVRAPETRRIRAGLSPSMNIFLRTYPDAHILVNGRNIYVLNGSPVVFRSLGLADRAQGNIKEPFSPMSLRGFLEETGYLIKDVVLLKKDGKKVKITFSS